MGSMTNDEIRAALEYLPQSIPNPRTMNDRMLAAARETLKQIDALRRERSRRQQAGTWN